MPNLSEDTSPRYLVDDLFEEGTLNLIAASPNTGKTAFSLALAKGLITGTDALGFRIKRSSGCVFLQYDLNQTIYTRANALFAPNCPVPFIPGEILRTDVDKPYFDYLDLTKPSILSELADYCEQTNDRVIFIDTLSSAFRDTDENNNNQMSKILANLKHLTYRGNTVMLLHHVSKSESGYSTTSRGASAIEASVDSVLKLKPTSKPINGMSTFTGDLTKSRSATKGHKGTFGIDATGIYRISDNRSDDGVNRVINAFTKNEATEMTRSEIQEATGLGNQNLAKELDALVKASLLLKKKVGYSDVYTLVGKE